MSVAGAGNDDLEDLDDVDERAEADGSFAKLGWQTSETYAERMEMLSAQM